MYNTSRKDKDPMIREFEEQQKDCTFKPNLSKSNADFKTSSGVTTSSGAQASATTRSSIGGPKSILRQNSPEMKVTTRKKQGKKGGKKQIQFEDKP